MHLDPLRVLVVDDSAYNRRTISAMLAEIPGVEVVGRAADGLEALRLVHELDPDCITLDLEMPELDGFSFLRLLMAKRAIPVIVISGYARGDDVFRALELGALDFIAKPKRYVSPDIVGIADQLRDKLAAVRRLRDGARRLALPTIPAASPSRSSAGELAELHDSAASPARALPGPPATELVVIGASTGGPPAVQQLLAALNHPRFAVAIAQHMPSRFTSAFAARLDRVLPLHVVEAEDGQPVVAGVVYVAPGGANLEVFVDASDAARPLRWRIVAPKPGPGPGPLITPSVDELFRSAAEVFGHRLCAVVLTGMGSDGTRGAAMVRSRGGRVLSEDPATAVMPGMPQSVVEAGLVDEQAPIGCIPELLSKWAAGLAPAA